MKSNSSITCASIALLLFTISVASAGGSRPKLLISLRDGKQGDHLGVDAILSWNAAISGLKKGVTVQYGLDLDPLAIAPRQSSRVLRTAWARIRKQCTNGWAVSTLAIARDGKFDVADLILRAENDNEVVNLSVKLLASAGRDIGARCRLLRVDATKGFYVNGASLYIHPSFNVETEQTDIAMEYKYDNTELEVQASNGHFAPTIRFSRKLDDCNRIEPTVTLPSGEVALAWERKLARTSNSSITATLKPNKSLHIKWKDNALWAANIHFPLDGVKLGSPAVSMNSEVRF